MFKEYPKEIILSDGTGLTLRPLRPGDEAALHRMFGRFSADDRWFLEGDVTDFELLKRWVNRSSSERKIALIGELEGRIIAHASLVRQASGYRSHVGKVRVSVDPAFRERHLGTWMLLDVINLAMSMRLELLVMRLVEDRDASVIKGLRKLDFDQEAVLKGYARDQEGRPHNLVIMVKRVHRGWK